MSKYKPVVEVVENAHALFSQGNKGCLRYFREDTGRQGQPEGAGLCTDMPILSNANRRNGLWRGRIDTVASVCFCAAENCWAKFSTASLNRPVWDTGAFRNRALSTSFMSARHSQRWRSWTTMVDIARPRDRAVTFVARSARSVAVRSSLRTPGS